MLQDQLSWKMIGMEIERGGLYYLETSRKPVATQLPQPFSRHNFSTNVLAILRYEYAFFFSQLDTSIKFCAVSDCVICPLAKQTRFKFPLSSIHTSSPFELVHVDIWGGYQVPSLNGALTMVYDYTLCTCVYLMGYKSDTSKRIPFFINLVETQFSLKVNIILSDNGLEFKIKVFYLNKGIIHQTSCVSAPQQK